MAQAPRSTSSTAPGGRAVATPLANADTADPEAIAEAVRACPAVIDLSKGNGVVEIASYLPGKRVSGVRVDADAVSVHIVASDSAPLPPLAEAVRQQVQPLASGRRVDVFIDDIQSSAPAVTSSTGSGEAKQ